MYARITFNNFNLLNSLIVLKIYKTKIKLIGLEIKLIAEWSWFDNLKF